MYAAMVTGYSAAKSSLRTQLTDPEQPCNLDVQSAQAIITTFILAPEYLFFHQLEKQIYRSFIASLDKCYDWRFKLDHCFFVFYSLYVHTYAHDPLFNGIFIKFIIMYRMHV